MKTFLLTFLFIYATCETNKQNDNTLTEAQGGAYADQVQVGKGVGGPIVGNPYCARRGMTWAKQNHNCNLFVDSIGCTGGTINTDLGTTSCNPYVGDTNCNRARPLLCHNPSIKLNRAPYQVFPVGPGAALNAEFYQGWTGSFIRETPPVVGCSFANRAAVDAYCVRLFGCGFQVLEFHDGFWIAGMNGTTIAGCTWNWAIAQRGGWNVRGYGNVPSNTRYWVYINDTNANCWAH